MNVLEIYKYIDELIYLLKNDDYEKISKIIHDDEITLKYIIISKSLLYIYNIGLVHDKQLDLFLSKYFPYCYEQPKIITKLLNIYNFDVDNPNLDNINRYDAKYYIEYIIHNNKFDICIDILNGNINENMKKAIMKYLIYFPDNILCKILNNLEFKIFHIILYYVNYKINDLIYHIYQESEIPTKYYEFSNYKFIPFEYFPINNNNLLYTFMILINDGYININNKYINTFYLLTKFNNIFNKLHYDLQIKICDINNISYNDIRICSMYLL